MHYHKTCTETPTFLFLLNLISGREQENEPILSTIRKIAYYVF